MNDSKIYGLIAAELGITNRQVSATAQLLDEGATVPFISRYRKEITQGLDEVAIEKIKIKTATYRELEQRKTYILQTITEQGKLTPELEHQIVNCWDSMVLEDLYLPYKPKRKTRATVARENGLEPLADWLLLETDEDANTYAKSFLNETVKDIEQALEGARDIIAERINEDAAIRAMVRTQYERYAIVSTKVYKSRESEAAKFKDYFAFSESLKKCPSHRLLAMFRGEDEGFLKLTIAPENEDDVLEKIDDHYLKRNTSSSKHISEAITDAYDRLLAPSIEN